MARNFITNLMKTLHTQLILRPAVLTEKLFRLERQGRYAEALAEAKQYCNNIDTPPALEGFSVTEAAEMILRLGVLIGCEGHNNQTRDAQVRSKDFLTEARQRYIELGNIEKIAECENYLTLVFWQSGELSEARVWNEESFSHNLPNSSPSKIYAYVLQSLINISTCNYQKNFDLAAQIEGEISKYGDAFLNGSFSTNIGIAYEKIGNHQKSLHYLELARYYHQRSRHKIYLGTVENNLAQLYKLEERFQQAHLASDNATKIFKQIKDRTREGFSLDTKAQIFIHEQKFDEALQVIEKALKILAKTENKGYFVETMLTKVKALVHLDEISAATMCLFEAVEIAKVHIGEETANNLIKEFENTLREKMAVKPNREESAEKIEERVEKAAKPAPVETQETDSEIALEFVLPPQLSHYDDIQVVQIQNRHLEAVGLKQDSLAIVVNETVNRGDLAAISERETEAVMCGFYDCDFGIVCLEGIESEPQLFDENEIEILGKIVGVCDSLPTNGNKLFVQPLKF